MSAGSAAGSAAGAHATSVPINTTAVAAAIDLDVNELSFTVFLSEIAFGFSEY
jgi:hypothetical protein